MRGQTAIEYLMTYGWLVVIVLIVTGVLAYYGMFSPSGFLLSTSKGFGQIQVQPPWDIKTDGSALTMNIQNRVGGNINITKAAVKIGSSDLTYNPIDASMLGYGSTAIRKFVLDTGAMPSYVKAGDAYTATVTITYVYLDSTFASSGTISGTYS
jgi:hypothetical protein